VLFHEATLYFSRKFEGVIFWSHILDGFSLCTILQCHVSFLFVLLFPCGSYGGCGIDLHLLKAPFCTHFPIHRDNMVTQMDANFHPTFTARLAKFVKQQEAIDERDAAVAEQTRTEFDSSTCGAVISIGKLIVRWFGGWLWSELSVLW